MICVIRDLQRYFGAVCLLALALAVVMPARAGDDWPAIPPEQMALKDDPLNPGAHAVTLVEDVYTDHEDNYETHFVRLKIFDEEGKKYGDIELPVVKGFLRAVDIEAHTVRPDGTVVPFTGKVFEKTVLKHKRLRVLMRTFTLPEVTAGCIIEYRYKLRWDQKLLIAPNWYLQGELSVLHARYRMKPYQPRYTKMGLGWTMRGLPLGKQLERQPDGTWLLELDDIPAYHDEDYTLPENELKMRVMFYYSKAFQGTDAEFWKEYGSERYEVVKKFIDKKGDLEREVARLTKPGDSQEEKLRKLYARCQQLRNLSFERSKTEKEEKREKLKDNHNVKDVLQRNYGNVWEINALLVGLAQTAGVPAAMVYIVQRSHALFHPEMHDPWQLNTNVVWVKLGDRELYLDPSMRFAPYGLLPWTEADVGGVRLEEDGGVLVTTTAPQSQDAVLKRTFQLTLDAEGGLSGKGTVEFMGQEALDQRLVERFEDEAERRKDLEDDIKDWLPAGATVEIESDGDWEGSDKPLQVRFHFSVPEFAVSTGRRLLLPASVFESARRSFLQHAKRIHPIYFAYPWQEVDEIEVALPEGYEVEALPKPQTIPTEFGSYQIECEKRGGGLHLLRRLVMNGLLFRPEYYPVLQGFFNRVRESDEQQAVLQLATVGAKN